MLDLGILDVSVIRPQDLSWIVLISCFFNPYASLYLIGVGDMTKNLYCNIVIPIRAGTQSFDI